MKQTQNKIFLSITEFAEKIGVHQQTVRRWDSNGTLKPHHKTPSGYRIYSQQQVDDYLNSK